MSLYLSICLFLIFPNIPVLLMIVLNFILFYIHYINTVTVLYCTVLSKAINLSAQPKNLPYFFLFNNTAGIL